MRGMDCTSGTHLVAAAWSACTFDVSQRFHEAITSIGGMWGGTVVLYGCWVPMLFHCTTQILILPACRREASPKIKMKIKLYFYPGSAGHGLGRSTFHEEARFGPEVSEPAHKPQDPPEPLETPEPPEHAEALRAPRIYRAPQARKAPRGSQSPRQPQSPQGPSNAQNRKKSPAQPTRAPRSL